jgi:hypothetical protein
MHAWVKWTAEAGKGLFVRNDVLLALVQGVLAHVQGEEFVVLQSSCSPTLLSQQTLQTLQLTLVCLQLWPDPRSLVTLPLL